MRKARKPYGQMFWDRLKDFPPILCRLLARHPRGKPMSTMEIADASGLTPSQVEAISWQTSWGGVDLPTARQFMQACRTDLSDRGHCKRLNAYLRAITTGRCPHFIYLFRHPNWKDYYREMVEKWARLVCNK